MHEDSGLFACAKGRLTKEATRLRLECPKQIEDDLKSMRDDFLMNEKSQMLVMISMATDEMIQLVAMYPDVLGWEIRLQFRGIPQLFRFRTFWTPDFSSEFYFSDRKMCSRQF